MGMRQVCLETGIIIEKTKMESGTMNWRRKLEKERQAKFICLECGMEENIPKEVVIESDIEDNGDRSAPATFSI